MKPADPCEEVCSVWTGWKALNKPKKQTAIHTVLYTPTEQGPQRRVRSSSSVATRDDPGWSRSGVRSRSATAKKEGVKQCEEARAHCFVTWGGASAASRVARPLTTGRCVFGLSMMDEWNAVVAEVNAPDALPLYDGCVICAGLADSKDAVVALLRTRFSNRSLFADAGETRVLERFDAASQGALVEAALLLVGAQRRADFRPLLERAALCAATLAAGAPGHHLVVDVPYFAVHAYVLPVAGGNGVCYVFFAQWMTGVC